MEQHIYTPHPFCRLTNSIKALNGRKQVYISLISSR